MFKINLGSKALKLAKKDIITIFQHVFTLFQFLKAKKSF